MLVLSVNTLLLFVQKRCMFVNLGAACTVGLVHHGKQSRGKQAQTLLSQKEPLCHKSNTTSVHSRRHKTKGNNPLLQGGDKLWQQKTGEVTGQWIENELKAIYRELEEHPRESVGSRRDRA